MPTKTATKKPKKKKPGKPRGIAKIANPKLSPKELAALPQDIRMLDSNEVAGLLGVNPQTVSRWMRTGELPSYRFGGSVRFKPADIARLIDAKRVEYTPSFDRVPKRVVPKHMLESTP